MGMTETSATAIRAFLPLPLLAMLAACAQGSEGGNGAAATVPVAPAGGGAAGAAGVSLQPGLWESTIQVSAADMPQMPPGVAPPMIQPMTARNCITPEQAANPGAQVMGEAVQQPAGCRNESYSFANGRIEGSSVCTIQGAQVRTTISGQYTATTYDMTVQSQPDTAGTTGGSQVRVTARRVGDCPAG